MTRRIAAAARSGAEICQVWYSQETAAPTFRRRDLQLNADTAFIRRDRLLPACHDQEKKIFRRSANDIPLSTLKLITTSLAGHEMQVRGCRRHRKGAKKPMMNNMMDGSMMWAMGLAGILGLVVIVFVIVALIKYLFFR